MMRHSRILALLALIGAVTLAGCSSKGEGQGPLVGSVGKQVLASIKAKRASKGRPPAVQVTPEQLANTKVAALQVNLEDRGGSDFLRRVAQRRDAQPGTVSVWRASDGALLHLRGGVITGSRGIGGDIISSDASATIQALAGARAGQGIRRYSISNGDYSATDLELRCKIANLGTGKTQIVNFQYATMHLRETCIGGAANRVKIENDYWVELNSRVVRRSRQWVGPLSGYFELILLKN